MNKICIACLAFALTTATMTEASQADQYAIALPSQQRQLDAKTIMDNISNLVLREMKSGDTLIAVDSLSMDRVVRITIPDGPAFQQYNVRRNRFRKQLGKIYQHLNESEKKAETRALEISLLLAYERMGEVFSPLEEGENAHLLIISNPIENNPNTPNLSFKNGRYPSDGHIKASKRFSPFGTANLTGFLKGINVHVLSTALPGAYASAFHFERIHRFNYLSVAEMGGSLVTFTKQPDTAFERMAAGYKTSRYQYDFDMTVRKITMLDAPDPNATPIFIAEPWLSPDAVIETTPPPAIRGPVKVGIRWDCTACDLDIYARDTDSSPWIYYSNRQTSSGRFFKDWMSSPDASNGLEVVQFTKPVLLENMQVMVNFYSGDTPTPPSGALRIFFGGKVYEAPFQLNSTEGDKGANRSSASYSEHWHVFNLGNAFERHAELASGPAQ